MPRLHAATFAVFALALGSVAARAYADDPPAPSTQAVDLQNTKCPVTGQPAQSGITATVDGAIVHFCCTRCPPKYRANPSIYQAALRSEPEVAKRMDALAAARREAPSAEPARPAPEEPPAAGEPPPVAAEPTSLVQSDKGAQLHDAMRKLWDDHVSWTRLFVVSALAGLPDKDATTKRLLRNQADLGNGIKPFYGDAAGAKLTKLLEEHITTAADLVGALKAKDTAKADAAKKKWSENADAIAAFLSGANPAWPLADVKAMMREHLDLTAEEVAARLKGDWDADVAAYEKIHEQAMKMADMLSDGIRRQFPDKFR